MYTEKSLNTYKNLKQKQRKQEKDKREKDTEKDKKIEKGIERARDKDTERETDKDLYIYMDIYSIQRETQIYRKRDRQRYSRRD